ncbi:hypothetical protein B0H17DRAFT_1190164 [Mycena rosella]|uniref:Uncharacterized protein n=1 Tax=Mycena rosella TaxID=1033263 RepID=A0AAD7H203_MYCRO|nr:hypothetical protein B0H17DRAFT_1190164 [Mycena rosella]
MAYLDLTNVIPLTTQSELWPVVSLPLLDSVRLQQGVESCNTLLRHIVIPPSARVSVIGTDTIDNGMDITSILASARASSAPPLRWMELHSSELSGLPSMTMQTFTDILARLLEQIMTNIPCSQIPHLDCRTAAHITVTSWKILLAGLLALETVHTLATTGPELFKAVLWPRAYGYGRQDISKAAPALHALQRMLVMLHARGTPLELLQVDQQPGFVEIGAYEWEGLVKTYIEYSL